MTLDPETLRGVMDLESDFTRLREENARLQEAGQSVVSCFGCGGEPWKMITNLTPFIADLAEAIGDERATKALKEPS